MKITKKSIEKELNSYFYYLPCINLEGDDLYMCTCGNLDVINPDRITYKVSDEMSMFSMENDNALNTLLLGKRIINSRCSRCEKDLSSENVSSRLQNFNLNFFERYSVTETENQLELKRVNCGRFYNIHQIEETNRVTLSYKESFIRINKKSGKIFIKQSDDVKHSQIQLNEIFDSLTLFFKRDSDVTHSDGYIAVHDWIGRLSRMVRDTKNMNIVDELLNYMIGKSGFDTIAKIAVIFLSIISYPNLSTISLTKGNVFLFDLIANCSLPLKDVLKKNKATSPLKIFNLLVSLKNQKLQEKLDKDDINKLSYVHTTTTGTSSIINRLKQENLEVNVEVEKIQKAQGKIFVRDEIKNKVISPFWFNKLKRFSDYEKSIQWLRIVKYEQFIDLLNKYDIDFLLNAYRVLEFRDDLNFERINQFLELMKDYCITTLKLESEDQLTSYEPVVKFDFNLYDDCYRMIEELKWEPKKVLFKIKKMDKLHELHENLLKHRSYVNNSDINDRFIKFSQEFKFLENYSENIGIHFKIKVIETPEELMNQAVEMHNCAGSYVRKVANGQYISFLVWDESPERTKEEYYKYMMVLEITSLGLEFVGIKSKFNKYGSNRFKEDVKKYLIDKSINFKDVPSIKTDIQSNEVAYKGFFENMINES